MSAALLELRAVRRAATSRNKAEATFSAAIQAARDAGASLEAIGEAAGLSRQGIHYLLGKGKA